jgi:hypothetical protein
MTQSLIAFLILQLASVVIICAFATLERLRSETGRVRGNIKAKPIARPPGPARKGRRPSIPQAGRSRSGRAEPRRAAVPGWPKPNTVA